MKGYPFFIGGPLDGDRVPYVCHRPIMRQFLPAELEVLVAPPDIETPIRTVEYRRELAFWDFRREMAECWVYGAAGARHVQGVEIWFRCLPKTT